jgi:hypothetical protein
MGTYNIGNLIPDVRLAIGDTDPTKERYAGDWIRVAITGAIKSRWLRNVYWFDSTGMLYRSPNVAFDVDEPPVIRTIDERPIILLSAISMLEGSLENSAWDLASWRDAEIAYSNLEMGRIRTDNLKRLKAELDDLIIAPTKRLARPLKGDLPGFKPVGSVGFEHGRNKW